MSVDLLKSVEEQYKRTDLPELKPGLTVQVHLKVQEGQRTRIQVFEGVIISKTKTMITVRRTSFGIGVERIFPLNSKIIDKIVVVRRGKIRRSKLYYLRKATSKKAKLKEIKSFK
jgi:large subunit ribosomal protein L19